MVAILRDTGGGRSLILNGHIDTVTIEPTDEWTRDPFGAEVENGLMYGRGTSDMKGGLMAAVMALTYLRRAGAELRGDIIVQSVVNEEHAGNGTLDLVRRGYTADAAIVLEPTNNTVAVSHPGGLYWQVRVPGLQRSPGARWNRGVQDGVSAIEKLPRVIDALVDLERRFHASAGDDPMEEGRAPFSLVIGKVTGGFYETVTAGEAILRGGAYFAPGLGDIAAVMESFRRAIDDANAADSFLKGHPARCEFLHHDDSTRQSPQIPLAVHMCGVLEEDGGGGNARCIPGPSHATCATWSIRAASHRLSSVPAPSLRPTSPTSISMYGSIWTASITSLNSSGRGAIWTPNNHCGVTAPCPPTPVTRRRRAVARLGHRV